MPSPPGHAFSILAFTSTYLVFALHCSINLMMLCRFLLYISVLTSVIIAAPPSELTTNAVEARSDSARLHIGAAANDSLEQHERRCSKIGSYFLLINATPWNMTLTRNVSYQMNLFNFPKTIKPGDIPYFIGDLTELTGR